MGLDMGAVNSIPPHRAPITPHEDSCVFYEPAKMNSQIIIFGEIDSPCPPPRYSRLQGTSLPVPFARQVKPSIGQGYGSKCKLNRADEWVMMIHVSSKII